MSWVGIFAVVSLGAGVALGQEQQAAPAVRPVATKPSASAPATQRFATTRLSGEDNPKRVLTLYAISMAAGDAEAVRGAYVARSPEEQAVVDAYAHLAKSVGALKKAANERYGPDGFDNIGFARMFAEQVKALEQTRLFVDGPTAIGFIGRDEKPDLRLVRVEGAGWKISPAGFANLPRAAARIEAQAQAYEELAAEIAADKYRLATDARVAGRSKVQQAMRAAEERLKATDPAQQAPAAGEGAGGQPVPQPEQQQQGAPPAQPNDSGKKQP